MLHAWFIKFIALQVPWIFNFQTYLPRYSYWKNAKALHFSIYIHLKALWIMFRWITLHNVLKKFFWTIGIWSPFIQKNFKNLLYLVKSPINTLNYCCMIYHMYVLFSILDIICHIQVTCFLMVSKLQKQIFLFSFEQKHERNYFFNSALPSKMSQIKKMKAHYYIN